MNRSGLPTERGETAGVAETFLTISYSDLVFERQGVYLSGGSFANCTFRKCTLIVQDFTRLGSFHNCRFEECVWQLNITVYDAEAWQIFLQHIAPAITLALPRKAV